MHSLYLFLLSLPAALAIWPAPQSLTTGDSVIWMDLHDPGYYFEVCQDHWVILDGVLTL